MAVRGHRIVQVRYGSQEHTLPLTVVAGNGPTLLGRDWLSQVQLNWRTIGITALVHGRDKLHEILQHMAGTHGGAGGAFAPPLFEGV